MNKLLVRTMLRVFLVGAGLCIFPATAAQYDFFGGFIPQGTPTIDGTVQTNEWNVAGKVTMSKFFGEDSQINVYLMWDTNYLYVAAEIQDYELWVDNHDAGQPWISTFNDDAFKFEIDANRSRDTVLQTTDKVFSTTPTGAGYRFDAGDGSGSTEGATNNYSGTLTNRWATSYSGTLNDYTFKTATNSATQDRGYTIEFALTWKNVLSSSTATSPPDGYLMGLNPVVLENDISGSHDYTYYSAWKRVYDEITSYMGTESVPQNWAEFSISATNDVTAPATLTNLTLLAKNEFSATLGFTASGDNGWTGYARSYEVRYWTNTVTTSNWNSVFVYTNNFRPKKAGQPEVLKMIGLSPSTSYSIGVRPMDERGNTGGLATVSFSTSATNASSGKGFITVAPGSRYLAWENGTPFVVIGDVHLVSWPNMSRLYNGPMWDQANSVYKNYYQIFGPDSAYAYMDYLRSNGVNTVRTFAEDFYLTQPLTLYATCSSGASNIVFNTNTLAFLQTYLDALSARGISAIISPFDTFYYNSRWSSNPLSTAKGGPMATADDFYNPAYIEYLKAIMRKLVETIGDRKNLVAWEFINEFDSDAAGGGWNHAAFTNREYTVNTLANYIRSIDSNHLVVVSSVRWDPKFSTTTVPDAALVLNNDRCQINSTHMYYHDIRDPNYNNSANPASTYSVWDKDRSIAPMVRVKQGLQFYYANSLMPKPYFDTEYGPLESTTPAYDAYFTAAEDDQLFHNMIWSHLASGEVGSGIRWPGAVLNDELSDQMRKYQLALSRFVATNIDFVYFSPRQIGQTLIVTNTSIPVVKTGISDGRKGIVFLVKDTRRSTAYGDVTGATLKVPDLQPSTCYAFEFWDTYDSAATGAKSVTNLVTDTGGTASVALPSFAKTTAIKFYQQCNLTITSPFGMGVPAVGTNGVVPGSVMTAALTNSPVVVGTTQYVCRGWVGTGSAPASGTTTNTSSFTITNSSTITWLWRTNFWLDVAYTGSGGLSTSDCWMASGSNLLITATAASHWYFNRWSGDTNGCSIASNTITAVMGFPRAISASFMIDSNKLIVSTPHGQAVPPVGTNWFDYGASNSVAITNFPDNSGGTQYVCRGWTGTGSIPASGVSSNIALVVLTNDSSIVWKWDTNYWLNTSVTGQGSVNVASNWSIAGTNILITATPASHYSFVGWRGATNGCTIATNTINVPMNGARTITAEFSVELHRLIVATSFGVSAPPVGTNWFAYGTVTNAVMLNEAVTGGGTQYVSSGWVGAGSVPATGSSTNLGTFMVTNDSVLTWLWVTNFWLDTGVNGAGSVDVGDGWIMQGSNIQVIAAGSNHSSFVSWSGDTNDCTMTTNRIAVPMSQARSIMANYADDLVLVVSSDYGVGTPAVGTNWYAYNSVISAMLTNSPVDQVLSQYVCLGWSGSGSVPASGVTTNTGPFAITNHSAITWLWQTNFWLQVEQTGAGELSTNDAWFAVATNVQVNAAPATYYRFGEWLGSTNGCTLSNNSITVVMDSPRALRVVFSEILATNGVPQWWLAQYGLTNFDVDAVSEVDGSGMLVWQKWVSGCDPTNPASVFRFTSVANSAGQDLVIRWPSTSNRFYTLSRASSLVAETNTFSILPGASNMPAMPVENSYTDTVEGVGPYFYKVDVRY